MTDPHGEAAIAGAWLARLEAGAGPLQASAPAGSLARLLARLVAGALDRHRRVLVVTRDDRDLAEIADAIDIECRPLCLILPEAVAVRDITLRASLSLLRGRLGREGSGNWPHWQADIEADPRWRDQLVRPGAPVDAAALGAALATFPVRVLPVQLAAMHEVRADWVIRADDPEDVAGGWPDATATLVLRRMAGALTAGDPVAARRAEIDLLTQELADLELELATAQAEIAEFTDRYHHLVGSRMARLDAVQAELATRLAAANADDLDAARRADDARRQARQSREEHERHCHGRADPAQAVHRDADLKKLFRSVAQKIHPDRASSEHERDWRTQLMSEANRAYREGDRRGLEEVLALWSEGRRHEPSPAADIDQQTIARLKRRIGDIENELKQLFASRLYELYTAAGIGRRAGRDLLREMAERLDADIAAAEAQLAQRGDIS
jgi:hypothetical protein